MTTDKQKGYIQKLRALPNFLAQAIAGLSEEQLTTVYIPNEWTIAQNIHHIADGNYSKYNAIRQILTEHEPPLEELALELLADLPDAKNKDVGESLEIIKGLHARAVYLLEHLNKDDWHRVGVHPKKGNITLEHIAETFSTHGERHIAQIKKTLEASL